MTGNIFRISQETAIIIAANFHDNIRIKVFKHQDIRKYEANVYLLQDGITQLRLVASDPIFNSGEEAETAMQELCEYCVQWAKKPNDTGLTIEQPDGD